MERIRAKAVCIFRRNDKVLLSEAYDPAKKEYYLIPIGGGIDFGETSEQAASREVLEETGEEAHSFQLLGVLENLFNFNNNQGHEIVFVYEAQFENDRLYYESEIQCTESNGFPFIAKWFSLEQLADNQVNIYPTGITNMLFSKPV